MNMKIVGVTLAAFVSLVVLAAVLMPILTDATTTEDTFTNEGYYDLTYTETDSVTMVWTYANPMEITLNGESMDLPTVVAGSPRTILCGDDWVIRWVKLTSGYYGLDYYTDGNSSGASEAANSEWTITANNGTLSITNQNNVTITNTYTYLYCIAEDGDLVMKQSDKGAYILGDSTVYAMGNTTNVWSGTNVYLKITGTVDDGFTASVFGYTGDDAVTVVNTSVNYTQVGDHNDLYNITSFVVTVNNGSTDKTITYSYFIVPEEVTAERTSHFTDNMNELLGVIPVLIIVAILIGVVALVIRSKLD